MIHQGTQMVQIQTKIEMLTHHPDPGSLVNVRTLGAQSLTNQEVL